METEFNKEGNTYLSKILKSFQDLRGRVKGNRILVLAIHGFFLSILFLSLAFLILTYYIHTIVPSKAELKNIENETASEIYSEDGILLGKYYIHERTNVSFEQISPDLIHALIATEDARFYEHNGIDFRGLARVLVKSLLLQDKSSGGGSTISEQLAKNLFPREKSWAFSMIINKLKEAVIAQKLETVFSKNEIITLYLNTVPFGENAYGIGTASQRFFSKTPSQLNIQESAVLVGMLKATSSYNPRKNPEKALLRRNVVLSQMTKYQYIDSAAADSVKALPLKIKYKFLTHNEGPAPYFREFLRLELQKIVSEIKKEDGTSYNIYTDGLKIYTTINSKMQKYAEVAVNSHMSQLQKSFYAHWGKTRPWGKKYDVISDAIKRSPRYKQLKEQGLNENEIKTNFSTPVDMAIFSYGGEKQRKMSPMDSIIYYQYFLNAGFMAMDANTGYVKAWVGGINHKYFKYDHVNVQTKRQVGSTFKPIVYAAALKAGVLPCDYIPNDKLVYPQYENWSPRNSNGEYGGSYSMQGALTNSVNTVSAQLILKAGINNVIKLAKGMGIQSPLKPVPSLALGTADISLYEMVAAYSTFANRGVSVKPVYVVKIEDKNGRVLMKNEENISRARLLSQDQADMMVRMLQGVVNSGSAARLRTLYGLKNDLAGKTGTTQSHADGWFVGFTPDLVAGAWVGAEDRRVHFRTIELGQGASMALPIWAKFMASVARDKQLQKYSGKFPIPSSEANTLMNCEPYIPPRDTTGFFYKIFGRKSRNKDRNENRKNDPKQEEKSNKSLNKIKNMFKRKKY